MFHMSIFMDFIDHIRINLAKIVENTEHLNTLGIDIVIEVTFKI